MFCVACGAQINGDAFCRKCGHASSRSTKPSVTIENVSRGKNTQIIGSIALLAGFIAWMSSCATSDSIDSGREFGVGGLFVIVGLILVMAGKLSHWYHAE